MFTLVYPCFTLFNLVYPGLSMFYPVYSCLSTFYPVSPYLLLFIHVLLSLTSFTPVYSRFTPLPEVTFCYHSLAQMFIMTIHLLHERASSSITSATHSKKTHFFLMGDIHREYFMESAGVRYLRTSC